MSTTQIPKQDSVKTQVIKDSAVYIPSTYVSQFFGLISAFLIRRLLGPSMMGIWATLQIIIGYGGYLAMGSMAAGAKEIPYLMGRKDYDKAEQVKNNIFTFGVLTSGLGAVLLIAGSWIFAKELNLPVRIGLVAVGFMLIGQRIYNFVVMLLRANKNFSVLSRLTIFTAVADVVLAGVLIWLFGIYGMYAAVLGSLVLSILFVCKKYPFKVRFALDREVLRGVSKIGLPLLVLGIVFTLLRTGDKILVVKYMGTMQMGVYSVALMASNYVFGFSNVMGIITLPRFSEKFGDKKNARVLADYMDQANYVVGYLLPVVLGLLYYVTPILIRIFLGKYVEGIPAMQVLLLGTFFLCLIHQPNNFLLAIGKQMHMLPSTVVGTILCFGLNYWAIRSGRGLVWVAAATSVSYLVTFLILYVMTERQVTGRAGVWSHLLRMLAPFGYVVLVLWCLDRIAGGQSGWWILPLRLALFGMAAVPLVLKVDRKTHVVRKAWEVFREKMQVVIARKHKGRPA